MSAPLSVPNDHRRAAGVTVHDARARPVLSRIDRHGATDSWIEGLNARRIQTH